MHKFQVCIIKGGLPGRLADAPVTDGICNGRQQLRHRRDGLLRVVVCIQINGTGKDTRKKINTYQGIGRVVQPETNPPVFFCLCSIEVPENIFGGLVNVSAGSWVKVTL